VRRIYLDYNATTPVAPSVVEAMQPFFTVHYGNPSSTHSMGRAASEAIADARSAVARLLGCDSEEIVFTSGGTESNNLALKGVKSPPSAGGHLVISAIEHPATTSPARFLERLGYEVSVVPCDEQGLVHPGEVENALRRNTRLVSIMHANNEVGTIQPIREIAEVCHSRGVLLHTDASQSVGKIPTLVQQLDVDLMTIAGHKMYGPKGVGALYVREGLDLEPVLHGSEHEHGLRAGTENTPYIVGLGQAAMLVGKALDESAERLAFLRDRLQNLLVAGIPGLRVNGLQAPRLPNTLSVTFPKASALMILKRLPELCASTGSACSSHSSNPSPTLSAMGLGTMAIRCSIRLSVGWQTSQEDVEQAAECLIDAWENVKQP
jgi:cysteine desulfurase